MIYLIIYNFYVCYKRGLTSKVAESERKPEKLVVNSSGDIVAYRVSSEEAFCP